MIDFDLRRKLLQELNGIVDRTLFGEGPWPPDPWILSARLDELGLKKTIAGDPSGWEITELGRSVDLDRFMVFVALWEISEIPIHLQDIAPMSEEESNRLWDMLEAGEEVTGWLKPKIQAAYRKYYGQTTCA